jgi:hypothetical protein
MWWRVWPTLAHTSLLSQALSFAKVFSIRKATRGRVRTPKSAVGRTRPVASWRETDEGEGGF